MLCSRLFRNQRGRSRSAAASAPPMRFRAQWMITPMRKLRVHQTGKLHTCLVPKGNSAHSTELVAALTAVGRGEQTQQEDGQPGAEEDAAHLDEDRAGERVGHGAGGD